MEQDTNELDWSEGQSLTGASDLQVRFVQELMQGSNKTQAYRDAGYAGDGSTLRSAASQAAKSHKVRALIAWAEAGGAGITDVPGDVEELKKILWRHARSKDHNRSIAAAQAIYKIEEKEKENNHGHDPVVLIQELAKILFQDAAEIASEVGCDHALTQEVFRAELKDARDRIGFVMREAKKRGLTLDEIQPEVAA